MKQRESRPWLVLPSGGLWRERDFLKFWFAQAISAVGSRITRTALPILAVMTIGASVEAVAVLSAIAVAPGVIVGLAMGGRVDRRAKRPLLIGADLVRAALLLTVPVAAWLGWLSMGQLYIVAALTGAATTLFQIADNAYLPTLIGRDQLVGSPRSVGPDWVGCSSRRLRRPWRSPSTRCRFSRPPVCSEQFVVRKRPRRPRPKREGRA
jgi:hypothetical protein